MHIFLRKLEGNDYYKGYIDLLSQLTFTGNISITEFNNQFEKIKANKNHHVYVFQDLDTDKIVGSGTIVIIDKMIHNCSKLALIEDVVIDSKYRCKNLGKDMINRLINVAKDKLCYKIILNCEDKNMNFYRNLGFDKGENNMVRYLNVD